MLGVGLRELQRRQVEVELATKLGRAQAGALDTALRARVSFFDATAKLGQAPRVELRDYGTGAFLSSASGPLPMMVTPFNRGSSFSVFFVPDGAEGDGAVLDGFEYDRLSSKAAVQYFPPLRFPGQYYDEESDLHENWNRYFDPATGRYLSPEPLLQNPEYISAVAGRGMSTPTYAYAANNPFGFIDTDGLKVNITGIRALSQWNVLAAVSARLRSCKVMTEYFESCFGSNPWTDSTDHEFVSPTSPAPSVAEGFAVAATTNHFSQTTTMYPAAFGANTVEGEAEVGATMMHELSHQMSLSTFDGFVYFGAQQPTGRCSANAFERLARCILTKGCGACGPTQCETAQGVQFGPEMYR